MLLVKNKHSAPISPPPVKGFPIVVFGVGVTPVDPRYLRAIEDHPSMQCFMHLLEVIDPEKIEEPTAAPDKIEEPTLSALPPLGGAK